MDRPLWEFEKEGQRFFPHYPDKSDKVLGRFIAQGARFPLPVEIICGIMRTGSINRSHY